MSQIIIELEDSIIESLKTKLSELHISVEEYISRLVRKDIKELPNRRDLSYLAGSWTEDDEKVFLENTKSSRQIDWEVWEGIFTPEEQKLFDEIYEKTGDLETTYEEFEKLRNEQVTI